MLWAQNNPYTNVAYFGMAYSATLHSCSSPNKFLSTEWGKVKIQFFFLMDISSCFYLMFQRVFFIDLICHFGQIINRFMYVYIIYMSAYQIMHVYNHIYVYLPTSGVLYSVPSICSVLSIASTIYLILCQYNINLIAVTLF